MGRRRCINPSIRRDLGNMDCKGESDSEINSNQTAMIPELYTTV